MGIITGSFLDKELPERMWKDMPLIFIAVLAASISNYILFTKDWQFEKIFWIFVGNFGIVIFLCIGYIVLFSKLKK